MWDVQLTKKGVGSCQKELQAVRSACEHDKKVLQEALTACQGEARVSNVSRAVELEELAVRAAEERAIWAAQKRLLSAEVADCRYTHGPSPPCSPSSNSCAGRVCVPFCHATPQAPPPAPLLV